jgi:hypothetical protein
MSGLNLFRLVTRNPNDGVGGGGCLCKTQGKAIGCDGPYAVFPSTSTIEPGSPHAVLSLSCARAIVEQADSPDVELVDLGTDQYDVVERINAVPTPDVEWADVPTEVQAQLQEQFPLGGLTQSLFGLVDVPPSGEAPVYDAPPEPEVKYWPEDVLPLEEPGDKPGEYVLAQDDDEVPEI